MHQYRQLVREVLVTGQRVPGRNGETLNLFGKQLELPPLNYGFPIITGRKMFYKGVLGEMAAFLSKPKHITDFRKQGCNYWDQWADTNGDIRVDYGNAWQDFHGVNQLERIVEELKENPFSRRNVLSGWNPCGIEDLSLPCCHYAYQFMVDAYGHLDLIWIQRSADVMIGLPSDMIAAALFNILMAHTTGYKPGRVIMQLGSVHIYKDHETGASEYLSRTEHELPRWLLDNDSDLFNFKPEHLELIDYRHNEVIDFKLIV